MEHEEYGPRAAYVVLSDDGAVVMNDNYNGLDAEAREKIQSFLKQQEEKEQKKAGRKEGKGWNYGFRSLIRKM